MHSRSGRVWEYGDYWISNANGTESFYACWYDHRAKLTRRRSLGTQILREAQDRLIELVGSQSHDRSRSPDAVALLSALNHYYENDVVRKPSAAQAFRSIQLVTEYLSEKTGISATVSTFGPIRQRDFMKWCQQTKGHSAATIARNLSVVSAAFNFGKRLQLVCDGFGNELEILLLDSAPSVVTQSKEVARVTATPDSEPRSWLPTFEAFGKFIDAIGPRQENLFRFVMMEINTWARPEAILDFRVDRQVNWQFETIDLNPPGRTQTKKFRPVIKLTSNLAGWLKHWKADAPIFWDGKPITTMKQTFKRHARSVGLPKFTQYTIRHFMATQVRRSKPPIAKEQRDIWLGHGSKRTGDWYEHDDPDYLADVVPAIEAVIAELQRHTRRPLSSRKLRAKASRRAAARKRKKA